MVKTESLNKQMVSLKAVEEADRKSDIVMGFTSKNWIEFMSLTRAERQEIRNKLYRNIDYPNIQEMTITEVKAL